MSSQPLSVFIAPADDSPIGWRGAYEHLLNLHEISRVKRHTIATDPAQADLILLTDGDDDDVFQSLRTNPLVKRYPEKTFTIYEGDFPQRFLPGVYASMPKSIFNLGRFATGSYSYCFAKHGNTVELAKGKNKRTGEIFFSFIGRNRATVRHSLFKVKFNRPDVIIEDSSNFNYFTSATGRQIERQMRYIDICVKSRFMLCPRGQGTSSIRLFEAMQLGCAPVIISDHWMRRKDVNWSDFAVFVKEKDVAHLPEILAPYDSQWREMGQRAREAWDKFFQPADEFNYIVESLARIKENRFIPESWMQLTWPWIMARVQLRRSLSPLKQAAKNLLQRPEPVLTPAQSRSGS